jgi:uncharacterized protein
MVGTGLERFELHREASGWLLRGTILMASQGDTAEARYEVRTDAAWTTRSASVHVQDVAGERSLRLVAERGRWYADDRELDALRDCADVDLQWSPVTNTLPIRRLGLAAGESRQVSAAWVRFPALGLEPLSQEYRRLGDRSYRYTSAGGAFVAQVDVDEHGLVVEYAGQWRRVSED